MDRRFHFAQRKSDVEHWISPDQWIVTPLSVLSDLHVPLHVWLLQLQTRNILSTAMTSEQTLWKGNQSSSSDCRGREKSSEKSRLQKQHPCHLFVTNKVTGGCLKGVFFFFFVFSQCLLHQMFPFCLFFFCHVKRMWRKLYETKITRQNQEGIFFFFVTNDLLLLTTWRPLGAKVRESLELRKSKCYGNLLQLVLAEFRLIHGAAL